MIMLYSLAIEGLIGSWALYSQGCLDEIEFTTEKQSL